MRIVVTIGFNKSLSGLLMLENLLLDDHKIVSVFIVKSISWKRLSELLQRRGLRSFISLVGKFFTGVEKGGSITSVNPLIKMSLNLGLKERTVRQWCRNKKIPCYYVKNLNEKRVIKTINQISPEYLVYSGGGILGKELIDSLKGKIINPHSGPLPEIRGMNAIEWAILLNSRPEVTIHFIDYGIDTGDIINTIPVHIERTDDIKDIRNKALQCGILGVVNVLRAANYFSKPKPKKINSENLHRQCYQLSPLLKDLLNEKLYINSSRV